MGIDLKSNSLMFQVKTTRLIGSIPKFRVLFIYNLEKASFVVHDGLKLAAHHNFVHFVMESDAREASKVSSQLLPSTFLATFPNLGAYSEFACVRSLRWSRISRMAYCAADVALLDGRRMCPQNWFNQLPSSLVYVSVLRSATMVNNLSSYGISR